MRIQILALAAAALLAPLPAAATDWYRIAGDEVADWYIDADKIEQNGQWTVAVQYTIYHNVSPETGVKRAWARIEFDCKARNMRASYFSAFGPEGDKLSDMAWPDDGKLHDLPANSPLERAANFVCGVDRSGAVKVEDPWPGEPAD